MSQTNPPRRGRPLGSYGKKKREELARLSQQASLGHWQSDPNVSTLGTSMADVELLESEGEDLPSKFSRVLDQAMRNISQQLQDLNTELRGIVDNHTKQIKELHNLNKKLNDKVRILENKVQQLQEERQTQAEQINKQERFSRRNNLRIVGVRTEEGERPVDLAREIFVKVGVENCHIERAHRDGRVVEGRDRHILVKVLFYMDKVTLLRNSRSRLSEEDYFLIDDLTMVDLKEKRKYSKEVATLYQQGTKLRFYGGRWRNSDGHPYNFEGTGA